jgi:hypothetical protein
MADVVTREEFNQTVERLESAISSLTKKMTRKYVPAKEAAEFLGVSVKTVTTKFSLHKVMGRNYVLSADLEDVFK